MQQAKALARNTAALQKQPLQGPVVLKLALIKDISEPCREVTPPNRDSGIFEDFSPPPPSIGDSVDFTETKVASEELLRKELVNRDLRFSCGSARFLDQSLSPFHKSLDDLSTQGSLSDSTTDLSDNLEDSEDSDIESSSCDSDEGGIDPDSSNSKRGYFSLWNEVTPDNSKTFGINNLTIENNFEKYFYRKSVEFPTCTDSFHFDQEESEDESYFDFTSAPVAESSGCCGYPAIAEDSYFDFNLASPDRQDGLSSSDELSRCEDYFFSGDDNPTDIESKMAETKIKMNDAILSNGREDLALLSLRLKQYKIQRGLIEASGVSLKKPNFFKENNNNNNTNCKYSLDLGKQVPPTPPKSASARTTDDNRYSCTDANDESPILDAYEKECQGVSEKMAKGIGKDDEQENKVKGTTKDTNEEVKKKGEPKADGKLIRDDKNKQKRETKHTSRGVTFAPDDAAGARHRPSPKQRRRERNALRRSLPQDFQAGRDKDRTSSPDIGEFDVYNMETAMPKIDWDAIEAHLKATKEEDKRRQTDREEIRRKLAMGADEEFTLNRPSRKPSLQTRLQSGMNLQICFMNETASDCESQCSDTESTQDRVDEMEIFKEIKGSDGGEGRGSDFLSHQARLQAEAHFALSQAKEMARMQMEIEKQKQKKSPIAEIVRDSFNKIGFPFPDSKRRMSRQILTDMNVAQLQVIVNDLHTQIENLNEELVTLLLQRDDLHMEQDSKLVDIEDLTKHLGAKQKKGILDCASGVTSDSLTPKNSPLKPKSLRVKTLMMKK